MLFVLSAPSGTGKTTVSNIVLRLLPNLVPSISYTTRQPREAEGEIDGKHYFFVHRSEFEKRIKNNDFLEWAEIYGNYYGTSRSFVEKMKQEGKHVLLVIDIQGALNLKKSKMPDTTYIFMSPPSLEELQNRLISRGTEDENSLQTRLGNAKYEMSFQKHYDHVVINNNINDAVKQFLAIYLKSTLITAESKSKIISQLKGNIMTNLESQLPQAFKENIRNALSLTLPAILKKEFAAFRK